MTEQLQAIATVLSLINPAISGAIFSKLENGRSSNAKIADAIKAGIAILVILALAAIFGTKVLKLFGISLDAFSCAGGFVLAWMGFGMIKGSQEDGSEDRDSVSKKPTDEPSSGSVSLTPLVLFAAQPGNDHRRHHAGGSSLKNGFAGDSLGCDCRCGGSHGPRHDAAVDLWRKPKRRICAGDDHELDGLDRGRHGIPICVDRH